MLAIDTETGPIYPGRLTPPLVCLSFAKDGQRGLLDHRHAISWMRNTLSRGVPFVGHNIAYDLAVLCAEDASLIPLVFAAYENGRVHDTMIREMLLRLARGELRFEFEEGRNRPVKYGLADLVKTRLGKVLEKEEGIGSWRLRYGELLEVPLERWPADAKEYALLDAQITAEVYDHQCVEVGGPVTDEGPQCRAAFALHLMSVWGVRTDGEAVGKLSETLDQEVRRIRGALQEKQIIREDGSKDLRKIEQLVVEAYQRKELEPPRTEKGRVSTAGLTLEESGDPVLQELAALATPSKLLSTYVPALLRGTQVPINARYNVLVASGRTSCGSPNLQNPPRVGGVRECLRPRYGYVYVSVDYDTLELRTLAQGLLDMVGWSKMAEALKAGKDLHLEFGAQLLGISYEEAVRRKKELEVKEARQQAKAANFGYPGGLGEATFILFAKATYGMDISLERAVELKARWFQTFPEMRDYFRIISDKVGFGGASIEQLVSGRVRGDCGFCEAANTYFQGLAADGAKAALFRVSQECYSVETSGLYGSRPVLFLHDEIIIEAPWARSHDAATRLVEVMCSEMARFVPDIPITASPALMDRWYKGAEAVYDATGRLVPWEPAAAQGKAA